MLPAKTAARTRAKPKANSLKIPRTAPTKIGAQRKDAQAPKAARRAALDEPKSMIALVRRLAANNDSGIDDCGAGAQPTRRRADGEKERAVRLLKRAIERLLRSRD